MSSNDPLAPSTPPGFTADLPTASPGEVPVPPARPSDPHPNFWWSIVWCIGFVFFTQIPPAVIAVAVLVWMAIFRPDLLPSGGDLTPKQLMQSRGFDYSILVAFACAELLVIGLSLLVIRLVVGRDWPRQIALRPPALTHTLMTLAAFPGLVLLANAAYTLLRKVVHLPTLTELFNLPNMEDMVEVFQRWPLPTAVLIIGLGPGIGEELWCRGFLGRGLVGRYGPILGVVFSSFFFGLIHLDPCQGTMAAVMGLFLHFVYLTSRSLYLPILLHFLNNALAVTAPRFEMLAALEKDPGAFPVVVQVAGVVLLLAVAWALYVSRVRIRDEGRLAHPWKPSFPGVAWPPDDGGGVRLERPNQAVACAVVGAAFLAFVGLCAACYFLAPTAP